MPPDDMNARDQYSNWFMYYLSNFPGGDVALLGIVLVGCIVLGIMLGRGGALTAPLCVVLAIASTLFLQALGIGNTFMTVIILTLAILGGVAAFAIARPRT